MNLLANMLKNHIFKVQTAREAFRAADHDEKIKKSLKAKEQYANDELYFNGDKVYFKEPEKLEWSGPATVIGNNGKVIFLKYGNNLRRVHSSKLVKEGAEYPSEANESN